ncbi:MAG TPA: LuxR C-terminal-related transcriptional regulator [Candidatus Cybelea sp.]|jgi:ATP/maltotriose-dependent transcriptional regulator MalT
MVRTLQVERRQLIERLDASANLPITLVIAPAGYGKSVALRQYIRTLRQPCVRFALRPEHTTLLSFLRGLTEALGEHAPHAVDTLAGAYERNQSSDKRDLDLAHWLNAHLESFAGVIAIDDLHVADGDSEVAGLLTALIECSKERVRWIIASRSTAGLPVGSWLAYRDAELPVDERELRFSLEEVAQAARDLGLTIRDDELQDLLDLTEGWPAALTFALRTSTRSADLRNVSAVTREMIYRFLAEQVYVALDDGERALLEVAVALPSIQVEVLERAGFDRALPIVERLRERTAFIYEESRGVYQCHDLFREFLRHQSALAGKRAQQHVQGRAARALEATGDMEHAIAAYAAAASSSDVLRLLEGHGFNLLERARSDVVMRGLEALDDVTRRSNSTALALQGALESVAGKFSRAESLLGRALSEANGNRDLIANASLRLAALMANQARNVSEVLSDLAEDAEQTSAYRAEALSLIAGQRATSGDLATASPAASQAERLLAEVDSEVVRAKVLHRIGIAYHHLGMAARAFEALTQSAELADSLHLFGLSSRVKAVLSNLVLHERDDVEQQLAYAESAATAATKAGDTFALQTALLQMLSAQMRRGHVEKSIAIEQRLGSARATELAGKYLPIFRSSRLAWEGRFREAHRLLATCWKQMTFSVDRLYCGAEYALFLAVDGKHDDAAGLTREIIEGLKLSDAATGLFRVRALAITRAFCALTETINGRASFADRILRQLQSSKDEVIRAVSDAAASIVTRIRGGGSTGSERVRECTERLRALDYADVAQLLAAVDAAAGRAAMERLPMNGLTRSEMEILRMLEEGLTPKQIAEKTSRSLNTVRVHVANTIAKLGCHGHAEAIRTARRLRLLG